MPRRGRERLRESYRNMDTHLRNLNSYATRLSDMSELDPYSVADTLKAASGSYVSIFYNMSTAERDMYMKALTSTRHKIKPQSNLLFIPTIMSSAGEDPDLVGAHIYRSLYAMPLNVLYNSSKSGLQLILFENKMAMKSVNYELTYEFSKAVALLDARIAEVRAGKINPIKDEELKTDFIEKVIKMSEETDINIAEIISDKVRTERHMLLEAQRLMRKAVHQRA